MLRHVLMIFTLPVCFVLAQVGVGKAPEKGGGATDPFSLPAFPERPSFTIPYESNAFARWSTLGQLCKQSDLIVVGTITNAITTSPEFLLDIQVESVLLGNDPGRSVRLPCNVGWTDIDVSTQGMVVAFAAREMFSTIEDNTLSWSFSKKRAKGHDLGRLKVLGTERGVIQIDAESDVIHAVRSYIEQLRQQDNVDPVRYARMLQTMQTSTNLRVKDDAEVDLLHVLRSADDSTYKKIIADIAVDEGLKRYVDWQKEIAAIRWEQSKRIIFPADSQLVVIGQLLKSKDIAKQLDGLSQLGQFRNWIATSPEPLYSNLVSMIDDTNQSVRFSAAALVAETHDLRALPVLIEGMENESLAERVVCKSYAERLLGRNIDFDPEASVKVRKAAIRRLKKDVTLTPSKHD